MTCETCPAYETLTSKCRKNPTTAHLAMSQRGPVLIGGWPEVLKSDWCMEHPARKRLAAEQQSSLVGVN